MSTHHTFSQIFNKKIDNMSSTTNIYISRGIKWFEVNHGHIFIYSKKLTKIIKNDIDKMPTVLSELILYID